MSALYGIQEEIMAMAEAVRQTMGIDMEVVDGRHYRVAGTGCFEERVNESNREEGHGYRCCLEEGHELILPNPGHHFLCANCPRRGNCDYYFEIAVPVLMDQDIIGVVAFVCTEPLKRNFMEENSQTLLYILKQIASLFAGRAEAYMRKERKLFAWRLVELLVEQGNQGVLLLDKKNYLIRASRQAWRDLGVGSQGDIPVYVNIVKESSGFPENPEYKIMTKYGSVQARGKEFIVEEEGQYARILVYEELCQYKSRLNRELAGPSYDLGCIFSAGEAYARVKEQILTAADSRGNLVIISGHGNKTEVISSMIYDLGYHNQEPYITVSCRKKDPDKLRREIFGYRARDVFTGNVRRIPGALEKADHGILVLEDVQQMPLVCQYMLAEFLQNGNRSGKLSGLARDWRPEVQLIAVSSERLEYLTGTGAFLKTFYYLLHESEIVIPPLCERPEELEGLMKRYISIYEERLQIQLSCVQPEVAVALRRYSWPNNVDELERVIKYCMNLCLKDRVLSVNKLPYKFRSTSAGSAPLPAADRKNVHTLEEVEMLEIWKAIELYGETRQGKEQAAEALGISIATLYRKLSRAGLFRKAGSLSAAVSGKRGVGL